MLAAASGADWRPLAAAVLLVLVDRALMAYRWVALLYTLDPADRPPLGGASCASFSSAPSSGAFLPSVGGDAVRAYGIAKLHIARRRRRGVGVHGPHARHRVALLVMALVGLTLARDLAGNWVIVASLGVAAGACLVTLLLVFSRA